MYLVYTVLRNLRFYQTSEFAVDLWNDVVHKSEMDLVRCLGFT